MNFRHAFNSKKQASIGDDRYETTENIVANVLEFLRGTFQNFIHPVQRHVPIWSDGLVNQIY